MLSSISNSLARLVDPDCHPTPGEVLSRIVFGTPFLSGAGAISAYALGKVTSLTLSPASGAILGASFALINTITSLGCNLLGIDLEQRRSAWSLKFIMDVALTALAAFALCAHLELPLNVASICVLIPSMFLAAEGLIVGGYAAAVLQLSIVGLWLQEKNSFAKY